MIKNLIVLPDGQVLSSGTDGAAIRELTWEQTVADGQELEPGGVCAAMVEFSVVEAPAALPQAGQRLQLFKVDDAGRQTAAGVFIAQTPVRTGLDTYRLTAYDPVVLLDQDITQWFASLDGWPYSLWELAQLVCHRCGAQLKEEVPPLGALTADRFDPGKITGRQLMRWLCQAMGCFCRADRLGQLELGWYTSSGITAGPEAVDVKLSVAENTLHVHAPGMVQVLLEQHLTLTGGGLQARYAQADLQLDDLQQVHYRMGALQLADYACAPVERVCIRAQEQDVGVVFPQTEGEKNTYCITGNPVLLAMDGESRLFAAQEIFNRMTQVCYVPGSLQLEAQAELDAGQTVEVVTPLGQKQTFYVMRRSQTGQTDRLTATGSVSRQNTTAVNAIGRQLGAKMLQLQTDVNGLRAEHRLGQEKTASLALDVEGITAQVTYQQAQTQQQLTQVRQTAQSLSVQVRQLVEQGASQVTTTTGYTFGADGLRITKTGQEMENLLDHTGMSVRRSGSVILRATAQGVEAADVQVRNYLKVGRHARLEDYASETDANRTACFYVEN